MVAYSFKQKFVGPIRAGTKSQTIRQPRKIRGRRPTSLAECASPEEMAAFVLGHVQPGSAMQLYTAMRTRHCRLIGNATCASVQPIRFNFDIQEIRIGGDSPIGDLPSLDAFAQQDGFDDFRGLAEFWRENHDGMARWEGVLIRWKDFEDATMAMMQQEIPCNSPRQPRAAQLLKDADFPPSAPHALIIGYSNTKRKA